MRAVNSYIITHILFVSAILFGACGGTLGAPLEHEQFQKSDYSLPTTNPGTLAGNVEAIIPSLILVETPKPEEIHPPMPFGRGFRIPQPEQFRHLLPEWWRSRIESSRYRLGVVVSEDRFAICYLPGIQKDTEVEIQYLSQKQKAYARVIDVDDKTGLALLGLSESVSSAQIAREEEVKVGTLAIILRYTDDEMILPWLVFATPRKEGEIILTGGTAAPGDLVITMDGKLLGIVRTPDPGNGHRAITSKAVLNLLASKTHSEVGFLGVLLQELTPELREILEVPTLGVLVSEVVPDSPAERAGIKPGDVITHFDGRPITSVPQLQKLVRSTSPDTHVTLNIIRDGKPVTLKARIGRAQTRIAASPASDRPTKPSLEETGIIGTTLNHELRRRYGIPDSLKGVVITEVKPNSAASKAGLRQGDVILEVNREPIETAEELIEALERAKDKILLRVWSRGAAKFLVLPVK